MPMYRIPEIAPPHATAKGTVLRGSRISSPMIDANSSPTSAKHTTPNANVQNSRDCAAPCDRERDSLTGLADFVTHDRRQLQSNQRKANNAECRKQIQVKRDAHIAPGQVHTEAMGHGDAEADQDHRSDGGSDAANVVDPLPDAKADNVQGGEQH